MITDTEIREFADHLWTENAGCPTALEVVAIFEVAAQGHPDQALILINKYLYNLDAKGFPMLTSSVLRLRHTIEATLERDRTIYDYKGDE